MRYRFPPPDGDLDGGGRVRGTGGMVWVPGEYSSVAAPPSPHWKTPSSTPVLTTHLLEKRTTIPCLCALHDMLQLNSK